MSNLWRARTFGEAASVGSFAIHSAAPMFTPWCSESDILSDGIEPPVETLEAATASAFARGFEEGRRAAQLELSADRTALADLVRNVDALQPEPPAALAAILAETVDRLVRQIVGVSATDAELVSRRAEAAAKLVAEEAGPSRIRLHPKDAALMDAEQLPLPIVADDSLERGSIAVESGKGWIEDGPAVRLSRLRTALDRLGAG